MGNIYRHPLYQKADAFKRAFLVNGFRLYDNGDLPEVEDASVSMELFRAPEIITAQQMKISDGIYALKSRLLPSQLTSISRELPVRAVTAGRVYDGRDEQFPARVFIEGVIADRDMTIKDLTVIWDRVIKGVYGITSSAVLAPGDSGIFEIRMRDSAAGDADELSVIGYVGPATWIARALLGQEDKSVSVWIFTIDVDSLTIRDNGLEGRAALYDNTAPYLTQFEDSAPAVGDTFSVRASNILRKRGYLEFVGEKVYTADAYIRMNMIQEAWDTNNQGLTLLDPLRNYHNPLTPLESRDGLPTVLTPALEQAMHDNFASGVEEVRLFEIGHIFKPGHGGAAPWEVTSLSIGAYGPELSFREFLGDIAGVLNELGISNHFFIPTNMAIAYRTDQCMVILDEKMKYLDGNCGHISPVALSNFKIDSEGFMAQFEIPTIEAKAAEEYSFVPNELK